MHVVQDRRGRTDHDDLVAEGARLELAEPNVRVLDLLDRVRRSVEVDPRRVTSEGRSTDRLPCGFLGSGDPEALDPVIVVLDSTENTAGVGWEIAPCELDAVILSQPIVDRLPLLAVNDLLGCDVVERVSIAKL